MTSCFILFLFLSQANHEEFKAEFSGGDDLAFAELLYESDKKTIFLLYDTKVTANISKYSVKPTSKKLFPD